MVARPQRPRRSDRPGEESEARSRRPAGWPGGVHAADRGNNIHCSDAPARGKDQHSDDVNATASEYSLRTEAGSCYDDSAKDVAISNCHHDCVGTIPTCSKGSSAKAAARHKASRRSSNGRERDHAGSVASIRGVQRHPLERTAAGAPTITNTPSTTAPANDATRAKYDNMAKDFAAQKGGTYTVQFELVCELRQSREL